ncbi:MAG: hypothetical protein JWQ25_1898 [Daejeonella sp.]|nr:hypothetical protein [Daejeonella sp.]
MKIFYCIILVFCSSYSFAQKKELVYYMKNNGYEVDMQDSADFIRLVREPDSGTVNIELFEYYRDGKLKRIGYASSVEPVLLLEGFVREFYPNGKRKLMGKYLKNSKIGEFIKYYENGKIQEKGGYDSLQVKSTPTVGDNYRIQFIGDTLGNALLDESGSGNITRIISADLELDTDFATKESTDLPNLPEGYSVVQEVYRAGKFTTGKRIDKDGGISLYDRQETIPEFKGGMSAFAKFLAKNFNYSPFAREIGVNGKVVLKFVVKADGSLTDFYLLRAIGYGCDEEALRVLKLSGKWKPATKYAKPLDYTYILPVSLRLEVER